MKSMIDYPPVVASTPDDSLELMPYILRLLAETLPADYACVVSCARDVNAHELIAEFAPKPLPPDTSARVYRLLRRQIDRLSTVPQEQTLSLEQFDDTGFQTALLTCLTTSEGDPLGILALFAIAPEAFTVEQLSRLGRQMDIVRTLLENVHLQSVAATHEALERAIQLISEQITSDPSPQAIVDVLHEHYFDEHVTSAALLLYGPVHENNPMGPFEYLEIKGSHSKQRGSGIGTGVRLYIRSVPDLLEQLDQQKILIYENSRALFRRLDPLLKVFLRAERVRSCVLLALHASQHKLGVLVVATDRRRKFTRQELQSYRTLSEFLAVNAMTQMLQRQGESIQQGRAALLDAVTDGVVMILPSAEGARVLTVNQRFSDMFGVTDADARGLPFAQLMERMPLSESLRAELGRIWLNIPVRDPGTQRGEFRMTHDQGYPMDIEWYTGPVYKDAHVLGRIFIFHDATAERTAIRLRSTFLSRVSHELRTPLTAIRGFAEFILEANGDQLPDLAREYIQIILDSAKHLNRVFTDIIEITRADAGELKLTREDAHLPDIIIDVVARMELMYKQRQQQVIMELDDDLPPVNVDVDRMVQVLTNLMTNAMKYSPEKTEIRIGTRFIAKRGDLPDSAPPDVVLPAVLVTITDQGSGLTKDEVDKVFMPFFRTEEAKKQKIEGVGLGLAVTRSIVEMHRGKIWAEPKKRKRGGCFLFTLPTVSR